MNEAQALWWKQARSDHRTSEMLRASNAAKCHILHYLQMAAEKLAKAYLWRTGKAPLASHAVFVGFVKSLISQRSARDRDRIAALLGFGHRKALDEWVFRASPLMHRLESLAPDLSKDGPNPEYPWPHAEPKHCPAEHSFAIWDELEGSGNGRKLLRFLREAIEHFDLYA